MNSSRRSRLQQHHNMEYTVIGIRQHIENQQSHEHGSAEMVQYHVFLKDETGVLCAFTAYNNYGDCSSGYTSASWGGFTEVLPVDTIGTLHYTPTRPLVAEFGANVLSEVGTGETIVSHDDDGGDSWYPAGSADFNRALFTETPRKVDRRKLYLFQGPSGVGKSYLAENSSLKVYETDRSSDLPKDLADYDIVVIGNKHPFTPADFKPLLKDAGVDVVIVSFAGRN